MVQDKYVANVDHKKYGISNHVDTLDNLEETAMRSNVVIATSKQSTVAKNKFLTELKIAKRLIAYVI